MSKRTAGILIPFLSLFVLGMQGCPFFFGKTATALRGLAYNRLNGVGVAAGDDGGLYTTTDNLSWILVSSGTTQQLNAAGTPSTGLLDRGDNVAFFYVVGNAGTIIQSVNSGVDWSPLSSGTLLNLNGLSFVNPVQVFVVGDSGLIITTSNGGSSWSSLSSGTTRTLYCVYAIGSTFIVAAGERGTILRTSDGGTTWSTRFFDTTKTFNKLSFAIGSGGGVMWVVGNAGAIYRSIDYGDSWAPQASNTTENLHDVYFTDGTTGAAVGDNGTVRNTTDGGVTWLADDYLNSLTTEDIQSIAPVHYSTPDRSGVDSVTVIGIAGNGIITVSSEPLTQVFEPTPSHPSGFTLHQNYPNPFNPKTAISFQLTAVSQTSLVVYDLLGREVATLVNEKLPPGDYERSFDGAGLASGMYLYRLTAGGFSETKKLLLMR